MATAMVIDTETPGFAKPLRPIELAGILCAGDSPAELVVGQRTYERYQCPPEVFEYGAMAVHNILPGDLAGKPAFNIPHFNNTVLSGIDYLVGHNVDFDWEVVGKPEIKRIDTLAISRYYWPDLDAHKLGAMIYHQFGLTPETRDSLRNAHSAMEDADNCLRLLVHIIKTKSITSWTRLYGISELGRIPHRMSFGKHGPKDGKKGMLISEMVKKDPGYVTWMKNNMADMDPYLRKALDSYDSRGLPRVPSTSR
jgi:exodeoxyribonuclease X